MSNGADDSLLRSLYFEQVQIYVNVACFAAAVYDNLHTLPLEVRCIWLSRVTIATILYYITRYAIYIDFIIQTYSNFTSSITLKGCTYTTWIVTYVFDICIWAGEALLGLRVWALYGKDRRLTFTLPIIFVALSTTSLVTLGTFLNDEVWTVSGSDDTVWIFLMFVLLTRSAYYEYKSGGGSRFLRMTYSEGLIYYFYTLMLHSGNLIAFCMAPPEIAAILTSPTRFLHVAFTCRVLLHTRQHALQTTVVMEETIGDDEET